MASHLQLITSPATLAAHPPPCRRSSTRFMAPRRPSTSSSVSAAAATTTTSSSSSSSGGSRQSTTTATGTTETSPAKVTLKLTYLEINGWVWEVQRQRGGGDPLRILVDPVVAGNLDFGMPWLYDGAKKHPKVKALGVADLLAPAMAPDLLLITSSLDDHCHARALAELAAMAPDLPVVTTPNARRVLAALPMPFRRVTYLEPGQSAAVGDGVGVLATAGPVWGPPWQRPENAYILTAGDDVAATGGGNDDGGGTSGGGGGLLFYEPHCVYDRSFMERNRLRADVVVTPVVKQILPGNLTIVSGQEDAVDLARLLRARYVVPMSNADMDATGLLTAVLSTSGTTQSFKAMMSEELPEVQVLDTMPGVPLRLELDMEARAADAVTTKVFKY
ncbi:hypothetical protein ACP70R_033452 [Stipagrostis hirtigluma subsp. patula]